jgi:hypothetical protein
MLVLHPPSPKTPKSTTSPRNNGTSFPAKTNPHSTLSPFGEKPVKKAFETVSKFGGPFTTTALRPELAYSAPATLTPQDQTDWYSTQTFPQWQPFFGVTKDKNTLTTPFFPKVLPVAAFLITATALVFLAIGTYQVGQKIVHDADESFFGDSTTATALLATTKEAQGVSQTATVIEGVHPIEEKDADFRQAEALSLLASVQAEKTTPQKSYKRADPLKPSIELVKHFSPKEPMDAGGARNPQGYYTPPPSGGRSVSPFPTANGVASANVLAQVGGAINIEEEPLPPAIRFVGWVQSKTDGRTVALIEVPNGSGVQTLAKPLNKPFTLEGQSVTLKKLGGSNKLEASVGGVKQVLGLETSGDELKPAERPVPKSTATGTSQPVAPVSTAIKSKITTDSEKMNKLSDEELIKLLRQLNQP